MRLSGEWQVHELGDLLNYVCCTGKQSVGDIVVGAYWSAAYGDAVGLVLVLPVICDSACLISDVVMRDSSRQDLDCERLMLALLDSESD